MSSEFLLGGRDTNIKHICRL